MEIHWENEQELIVHFSFDELEEQYNMTIKTPQDAQRFLTQNLPQVIMDVSEAVDGEIAPGMLMSVNVYMNPEGMVLHFLKAPTLDAEIEDEDEDADYGYQRHNTDTRQRAYDETDYEKEYQYGSNPKKVHKSKSKGKNNTTDQVIVFRFRNIYQMSEFVSEIGLAATSLGSEIYKEQKWYVLVLSGKIDGILLSKCAECANSMFPQQKQQGGNLMRNYLQEHGELVADGSNGISPLRMLSEL